jgi:hypothetical protein
MNFYAWQQGKIAGSFAFLRLPFAVGKMQMCLQCGLALSTGRSAWF